MRRGYSGPVRVRLLGPVGVNVDGVMRPVAGLRRQALLAVLALHGGRPVSADMLLEVVWEGDPPATAMNSLQSHLSYLRREFSLQDALLSRRPGYLLDLAPDDIDALLAERLVREAQGCGDPVEAADKLVTALGLWSGRALEGTDGLSWLRDQAQRLEDLRITAVRELADARLSLGDHEGLVPQLMRLAERYPLDEDMHRQLILALYHAGRRDEALETFRALRARLDAELGIAPSPALRRLEETLLRPGSPPSAGAPVPAQLPPAITGFASREQELARLNGFLSQGASTASLSGTPGVGKTALAVHWAHAISTMFPDGQLYVDLRGFSPGGPVVEPAEVLRGFLEALGVPSRRIPSGMDDQIEAYRGLVSGRRILVVLDNARDVRQVRPLLPESPGCLTIITSRHRLHPSDSGAQLISLGLLGAESARELLVARLGSRRVAAEPAAVDEIIERCAGLPLALAIVGARAATQPRARLASFAEEMSVAGGALDLLDAGDALSNVRAVFSASLRALSPGAAELFCRLGLHPGPEISAGAAASLAAVPLPRARELLGELARANLLMPRGPAAVRRDGDLPGNPPHEPARNGGLPGKSRDLGAGRFRDHGRFAMHDLLRAFAAERVTAKDAALQGLCDHYLHTAHRAAILLGADHPIALEPPAPGAHIEQLTDYAGAMRWLTAEQQSIVAMTALALEAGLDTQAWQIAWSMRVYLTYQGLWHQQAAVQRTALAAAQRLGDPYALAHAMRGLAYADAALGRHADARAHIEAAVASFAEAGRPAEQALALLSLSRLLDGDGATAAALPAAQRALEIYRMAGYREGTAYALNAVGWCHGRLGAHAEALVHCGQALELHRELRNEEGESFTLDSLGYNHHHLKAFDQAVINYTAALELFRRRGDLSSEAETSDRLGDSLRALGRQAQAREAWRHALDIVEQLPELNHPAPERLRAKIAAPMIAQ
jgi:DNA-binding SARP family transcriptional activator